MKKILCCLLTVILLVVLAGCSGGLTDEDFDVYNSQGEKIGDFETETKKNGARTLDSQELTKRGIGKGSTTGEFEEAYSSAMGELFDESNEDDGSRSSCYFQKDGKIVMFWFENNEVQSIAFETADFYQTGQFILSFAWLTGEISVVEDPEFLERLGYANYYNSLTSEEKELLYVLAEHAEYNYGDAEKFESGNILDPTTAAWLTAVQQKMVGDMYQKFVQNYDFGY